MNIKEVLTADENEKLFLLGNEATVRGALEAGVGLASTYPGTPSSEIGDVFSKVAADAGMYFEFSTNEKVALEVAAAAAASGVRSFTFMKHVGLNVASDSLMSVAYTSVEAGMVILSADDPSMFSSQNEQDNRYYARLANIPMVEPSNPQEIKKLMKYSYELSEEFKLPVLMRTTTRVSHMRGVVKTGVLGKIKRKGFFNRDPKRFVPVPSTAMVMHKVLVEKMEKLRIVTNNSPFNRVFDRNGKVGVITSGGAFNYVMDAVDENHLKVNVLKITLSYPFPDELVLKFIEDVETVLVVEEVDPIMEKEVLSIIGKNGLKKNVHGKLDGTMPIIYEYSPNIILETMENLFGMDLKAHEVNNNEIPVPERSPTLCPGCPHRAAYYSVKNATKALKLKNVIYPTDIGCYTLGALPPHEAMDIQLCMGASLGVGLGLRHVLPEDQAKRVVSAIGDSTFIHSGLTGLAEMVYNPPPTGHVLVLLDNGTTAMTGRQEHPGTGRSLAHLPARKVNIDEVIRAMGVDHLDVVDPIVDPGGFEALLRRRLDEKALSVIISRRPCLLAAGKIREYAKQAKEIANV